MHLAAGSVIVHPLRATSHPKTAATRKKGSGCDYWNETSVVPTIACLLPEKLW